MLNVWNHWQLLCIRIRLVKFGSVEFSFGNNRFLQSGGYSSEAKMNGYQKAESFGKENVADDRWRDLRHLLNLCFLIFCVTKYETMKKH